MSGPPTAVLNQRPSSCHLDDNLPLLSCAWWDFISCKANANATRIIGNLIFSPGSYLGINFETEHEHVHIHFWPCCFLSCSITHRLHIAQQLQMHGTSITPLGFFKKSWKHPKHSQIAFSLWQVRSAPNTNFPSNYPHLHNAEHPAGFPKHPENQSDVENRHSLPSLRAAKAPRVMNSTCLLSTCQVDASVRPIEQPKPPRFRKFAAMDWRRWWWREGQCLLSLSHP